MKRFVTVFLLFCIESTFAESESDYLQLSYNSRGPLVALFYKNVSPMYDDSDVIVPEVSAVEPPHDQDLYNFYHVLRMTQDNEDIDLEAARTFEKTENILRQALRARCDILNKCINKCPRKKKYTCTFTCKEEYDDRDLCDKPKKKPKKCYLPKCGKTMPPSWLLRNRN